MTRRQPATTLPAPTAVDTFIGIDPGLSGAVAVVRPEKRFAIPPRIIPTPTIPKSKGRGRDFDRGRMKEILEGYPNAFVAIERVYAMPAHKRRQGTGSMFSFGAGYGLWLGILTAQGKPFVEVYPQTWKARILHNVGTGKAASIRYARLVEPLIDLRPTPRSRVDSDGMADAYCLAVYARHEWAVMQAVLASSGSFR